MLVACTLVCAQYAHARKPQSGKRREATLRAQSRVARPEFPEYVHFTMHRTVNWLVAGYIMSYTLVELWVVLQA